MDEDEEMPRATVGGLKEMEGREGRGGRTEERIFRNKAALTHTGGRDGTDRALLSGPKAPALARAKVRAALTRRDQVFLESSNHQEREERKREKAKGPNSNPS